MDPVTVIVRYVPDYTALGGGPGSSALGRPLPGGGGGTGYGAAAQSRSGGFGAAAAGAAAGALAARGAGAAWSPTFNPQTLNGMLGAMQRASVNVGHLGMRSINTSIVNQATQHMRQNMMQQQTLLAQLHSLRQAKNFGGLAPNSPARAAIQAQMTNIAGQIGVLRSNFQTTQAARTAASGAATIHGMMFGMNPAMQRLQARASYGLQMVGIYANNAYKGLGNLVNALPGGNRITRMGNAVGISGSMLGLVGVGAVAAGLVAHKGKKAYDASVSAAEGYSTDFMRAREEKQRMIAAGVSFGNPHRVSGRDAANNMYWSSVGENVSSMWSAATSPITGTIGALARGGVSEKDLLAGINAQSSVDFQKQLFMRNIMKGNADIFGSTNNQTDAAFTSGGKVVGEASQSNDIGWYMTRLQEAYSKGTSEVVAELQRIRREAGKR